MIGQIGGIVLVVLIVGWLAASSAALLLFGIAALVDRRADRRSRRPVRHNPHARPCRCMTCHTNEAVRFFGDMGLEDYERDAEVRWLHGIPVQGEDNVIVLHPRGGAR